MTEFPGQPANPGRYLHAQRELADVSRNTHARLARVSESYLEHVEKGREQPTPEVLTAIRRTSA
jgi:transcriptional regulator with XRE-family HTH domain